MKTAIMRLVLLILLVTACNKENPTVLNSKSGDQIGDMVEQSIATMDNQEVYSDDSTRIIYMVNDGITPDFLAEEVCLEGDDTVLGDDLSFIRDHSFLRCLKGLPLTDRELAGVKEDLRKYTACRKDAIERAREVYRALKEKYRASYERLWQAFRNGTLSRERFHEKVAGLRKEFKTELRKLHLEKKLDDALKRCLREFYSRLKEDLTERHWNAFVDCLKQ